MHYDSRQEASANFYKLRIGDSFTDKPCINCKELLTGSYTATCAFVVHQHTLQACIQNLSKRIAQLEECSDSKQQYNIQDTLLHIEQLLISVLVILERSAP